jgi:hypothetical protein
MAFLQYATYADMVIPSSVAASSELPGFPPENVAVLGKPFRSWRSSITTVGEYIELTFPTAKLLVGVFVDQVLAGKLTFKGQATLVSAEVQHGIINPMPTDIRINRRKQMFLYGSPTSLQVLRIYPETPVTDDPNVATFEMGSIVPVTAWRTFPDHFEAPMTWKRMQSVTQVGLLGGGMQQQAEGRAYVQMTIGNTNFLYPSLATFLAQLNAPPGEPIIIAEEQRVVSVDPSLVYLMSRLGQGTSGDPVSQRISTYGSGLVYEELI